MASSAFLFVGIQSLLDLMKNVMMGTKEVETDAPTPAKLNRDGDV